MGHLPQIGVELEIVVDRKLAAARMASLFEISMPIEKRFAGGWTYYNLRNGWRVFYEPDLKYDGIPKTHATEIISPILENSIPFRSILQLLSDTGAYISRRCGMHVHVDAEGVSPRGLVYIADQVSCDYSGHITKVRTRCVKPVPDNVLRCSPESWDDLWAAWFQKYARFGIPSAGKSRLHPARRRMVNLGSVLYRGTVEIRVFESSLDYDDIAKAVEYSQALVVNARTK